VVREMEIDLRSNPDCETCVWDASWVQGARQVLS